MGVIIPMREFSPQNMTGILKPIIYCAPHECITEQAVSLSKELTQTLILCKPKSRTMQIEKCLAEVIAKLAGEAIIKDFDVLFNPKYKIDVLKIMVNACKAKPFSMIWPGTIEDGKLAYAEEGFADYKIYDVNDYDVTCVI